MDQVEETVEEQLQKTKMELKSTLKFFHKQYINGDICNMKVSMVNKLYKLEQEMMNYKVQDNELMGRFMKKDNRLSPDYTTTRGLE